MNRTRWRLLVACLPVLAAAIAVAGGSAGNRDMDGTLVAVPGPGAVNYGENIAYEATFTNRASNSAVFTQTTFVMQPPVGPGGAKATPARESCANGGFGAGDVLTCEFGQVQPGQTVTLTVVWTVPAGVDGCTDCLEADGDWFIKEGKPTNGNESLHVEEFADLIGVNETVESVNGNHRAGGYELQGCSSGSETNLTTNPSINVSKNPVVTSFCLPASFVAPDAAGGVASTITEPSGGANFARQSEVCIAEVGQNCPGGAAKKFADKITFTFLVAADALPNGFKIEKIFHNSTLAALPMCGTLAAATSVNGCVVSITPPKGPGLKVWKIVAQADTNGPWSW